MITNNDILDAAAALVEAEFPGEPVYRSYQPVAYKRPSTLLEVAGGEAFPNFSCGVVEIRPRLTLTTFGETDAYDHADTAELIRRQMRLLGLFLPGYIKVKNRAPRVLDGIEMDNGLDYAAITVPLSYTLNREEFMDLEQAETAGDIHIRTEVTTDG